MSNNPATYVELENQLADLKRQNEFINLNSAFQYKEKEKRAAELIVETVKVSFLNKL